MRKTRSRGGEERQGTGKREKVEEKIGQWVEGVIKQERGCEAEQPVGDESGGREGEAVRGREHRAVAGGDV